VKTLKAKMSGEAKRMASVKDGRSVASGLLLRLHWLGWL
jgi:hypothetical protein